MTQVISGAADHYQSARGVHWGMLRLLPVAALLVIVAGAAFVLSMMHEADRLVLESARQATADSEVQAERQRQRAWERGARDKQRYDEEYWRARRLRQMRHSR